MKLSDITEGYLGQMINQWSTTNSLVGQRPTLHNPELNVGADSGSRVAGDTSYPTGVPVDSRKRKFLGFNRPYRIGL